MNHLPAALADRSSVHWSCWVVHESLYVLQWCTLPWWQRAESTGTSPAETQTINKRSRQFSWEITPGARLWDTDNLPPHLLTLGLLCRRQDFEGGWGGGGGGGGVGGGGGGEKEEEKRRSTKQSYGVFIRELNHVRRTGKRLEDPFLALD